MEEKKEQRGLTRRFNLIFFLIFILFVSLVLRLAYLQLVEGEKYVRAAEELSIKPVYTPATRGWIYDRNGEVLVNNKPVYTVTFLDENLKGEEILAIAEKLEKILMPHYPSYNRARILERMDTGYLYQAKDRDRIKKKEEAGDYSFDPDDWELVRYSPNLPRYLPRSIVTDVPKEVMFYIEEHRMDLPGVSVIVDSMRQYKKGAFATHILGYIKQVPANKADEYLAKGYDLSDKVGYAGVELTYEDQLRGTDGMKQVRINNQSKTIQAEEILSQKPGNNLVLTIDWKFQDKVEKILEEEVHKLQTREKDPLPEVKSAIAVAMNPKTGEILAMANYPDYDLNLWNSPDFGERYATEIAGRERNQSISGTFTPGSTIKMLSVLIGLEEKLISPTEKVLSTGQYRIGDRFKKDWKRGGHGWVDARKAIKESVNTYMYELAMRLADYPRSKSLYKQKFKVIDYYHSQFGLGVKTGIDLPFEETAWKADSKELGRLADAMIGQYHNYTPIQLAQYVSAIANGGYRIRPHVVKEIREPVANMEGPGKLLMEIQPEVLNKVDIDPENLKVVQEGMLQVTQPGGTAYLRFAGLPIKVAAKTGTVERSGGNKNGLIVGYAPYEDPEIVFVVVVPGGTGGSDTAGPIARRILDAYFGFDQNAPQQ
jgi:penicillin-binding protein 2